jgi:hypothetical protein
MGKWTANVGGGLVHVTPADMETRIDDLQRQLEERRAKDDPAE